MRVEIGGNHGHETIHDARANLVRESHSYGLNPIWDKEVDLALTFGEGPSDAVIVRLENAVRRDMSKRLRRLLKRADPGELGDITFLSSQITAASMESKEANLPPTVEDIRTGNYTRGRTD